MRPRARHSCGRWARARRGLTASAAHAAKAAGGEFRHPREGTARGRLEVKFAEMELRMNRGTAACPHCEGTGRVQPTNAEEAAEAEAHEAALRGVLEALEKPDEQDEA
jgi:hypothetical protein